MNSIINKTPFKWFFSQGNKKTRNQNKLVSIRLLFCLFIAVIISGCTDDPVSEQQTGDSELVYHQESVTGVVQKGPFNSGSAITLFELNEAGLSQTGRSFTTQVKDNQGHFEFSNLELTAPVARFRADGFFFNEILGRQSASQITLNAIANVAEESGININVLSHLETPRIEYLVSEGVAFQEAKKQAQSEVLSVFHIEKQDVAPSESMNITSKGEDHAILLAVSSILLGYRSEAELSELLSYISDDVRDNGELTNAGLGSELINHAVYLNASSIKSNLKQRYKDLGVSVDIPGFAQYVDHFIDHSPYDITEVLIEYPETGKHGDNILDPDRSLYELPSPKQNDYYSLAAGLSERTSLEIKISTLEGEPWGIPSMWAIALGSDENWIVGDYDMSTHSQRFTTAESGKYTDLRARFYPGRYLVEYFEMGAEEPARRKEMTVLIVDDE